MSRCCFLLLMGGFHHNPTNPSNDNPLFDETGADAGEGQSGPVWFLAGVFNATGSAERTITLPAGKALFFPILNFVWISTEPTDPQTADEIRPIVKPPADGAADLACEIDGVSVSHLGSCRRSTPKRNLYSSNCLSFEEIHQLVKKETEPVNFAGVASAQQECATVFGTRHDLMEPQASHPEFFLIAWQLLAATSAFIV